MNLYHNSRLDKMYLTPCEDYSGSEGRIFWAFHTLSVYVQLVKAFNYPYLARII